VASTSSPSRAVAETAGDAVDPVDEFIPPLKLIPLGFQHVLVMYAGAVAVPLIIGRALKLPPEETARLINADLFACGVATTPIGDAICEAYHRRMPFTRGPQTRSRKLGMTGKAALRAEQLVANTTIFTPSDAVTRARSVMAACIAAGRSA
jgi:xanthine/uracil permease